MTSAFLDLRAGLDNGQPVNAGVYTVQKCLSLAEFRTKAPNLAGAAPSTSIFGSLAWFETLLNFGFDRTYAPYLLLVTKGDESCLLLPLVEKNDLASLSNFYSSLFEPINDPHCDIGYCLSLCFAYVAADRSRWPVINLQPLAKGSEFELQARINLTKLGYWTDQYFCFGNWYLEVQGRSFAQYFAQLPAKLRNTIVRGRSRLTRQGPWSIQIIPVQDTDVEGGLAAYEAVYRASWKEAEPFTDFIGNLCRMGVRQGWLRLGILTCGQRPIAAQLWMVKDETAYIFKLAYDADFSRFSPGSILTAQMMEHVIDRDRVQVVDYLTGDDAYKQDWMSTRRERVGVIAFNPATPRGVILGARHFLGRWMKRQWKNIR